MARLLALAVQILAGAAALVGSSGAPERPGLRLRGSAEALLASAGGQVPPLSVPDGRTPIHLLISAFQDGPRCANTIARALLQAEHPQRVSFNVIQAEGPGDVDCLQEFKDYHLPQVCPDQACVAAVLSRIRFWKIPRREGKGPVHQRGLLSERADVSGRDSMCLSTDSHMDFTSGWDRDILEDWVAADNEFAVLTAYPLATQDSSWAGKKSWISLCGYFLSSGVPRGVTGGTLSNGGKPGKPVLTMNWAAGQSFSRCHAERAVPVDKHLPWMFNGEEVNRAVRLWTHGYDLYNPRVNVVLHNYSHASQAFWSYTAVGKDAEQASSVRRLHSLLQDDASPREFGPYGLGTQRTLEDYVTWSHTDLGGKWRSFLESRGIEPLFEEASVQAGAQPSSATKFCSGLQRRPVRSTEALLASIGG